MAFWKSLSPGEKITAIVGILTIIATILAAIISPLISAALTDDGSNPTNTPLAATVVPSITSAALPSITPDSVISTPTIEVPTPDSTVVPAAEIVELGVIERSKNINSVQVTVVSIELMESGVKWSLLYENSSQEAIEVWFDMDDSYMTDNSGNRYSAIRNSENSDGNDRFTTTLRPGERFAYWVEFAKPPSDVENLTIVIVGDRNGLLDNVAEFNPIQIPVQFALADTASNNTPMPDNASQIIIGKTTDSRNINGVKIVLIQGELLPDDAIRWSFRYENDSQETIRVWFDMDDSYMTDNLGNRYPAIRNSENSDSNDRFTTTLRPGERFAYWVEFDKPTTDAQSVTIVIVGDRNGLLDDVAEFPEINVELK